MRINKFVARASGLSRRAVDTAILQGRVQVNNHPVALGTEVSNEDHVTLDGRAITPVVNTITIMLNKPRGYVCSRNGQGSPTIYDLLPPNLHHLKPVGRLDKQSSGLLLLTSDGSLAHQLTHPSFHKDKVYDVTLEGDLSPLHHQMITQAGILLEDGRSCLQLERLGTHDTRWRVTMHEGRNRQIRRTFGALGYYVTVLHRVAFGPYQLGNLPVGGYITI